MLSPAHFHSRVPRTLLPNLRFRRSLLLRARESGRLRDALKSACRDDLLFFVNCFVWQFNPQKRGKEVGPFITWPIQDRAFRVILDSIECDCHEVSGTHAHDLLIEKSRDMGASWGILLAEDWLWDFHPWKKFLCISRNAEAVDSKDPDSLFWKLRFIHRYLPRWLLPERMQDNQNYLGNEDNGSTITGTASTGKAGVGGRATAAFVDEFSQIAEDYEVLQRTADTTACRIFNGTHRGLDTAFFELSQRVDMRKLVLHWSEHPDKRKGSYRYNHSKGQVEILDKSYPFPPDYPFVLDGSPTGGPYPGLRSVWYDSECRRRKSPRDIAMDLDIDPKGSVAQFIDPLLIRQLTETFCVPPYWEGDVLVERDTGKLTDLVERKGGPLRLWIKPDYRKRIPAGRYAITWDVSTGSGTTNSCGSIGNCETGEKVGMYATPTLTPEALAPVAFALGHLFASMEGLAAVQAWETPGPGLTFGKFLMALYYPNIFFRETNSEARGSKISDTPGWVNNNITKRTLLEEYRAALVSRRFTNRCAWSLDEFLAFKYTSTGNVEHGGEKSDKDPTAARVNHGDPVISDALLWKLMKGAGIMARRKEAEPAAQHPGSFAYRRKMWLEAQRALD